jgi:hypothetical protein
MGYICHHAIVVTAFDHKDAETIRWKAVDLGLTTTNVTDSPVNGYASFMVVPDGSKEGWSASDAGNNQRDEFLEWLTMLGPTCSWAEVQYGDEGGNDVMLRHSGGGDI